jgi:hypothetical protein
VDTLLQFHGYCIVFRCYISTSTTIGSIAELNKLQLWGADVSSAYLEADTKETVHIITGDDIGKLSGKALLIEKSLWS